MMITSYMFPEIMNTNYVSDEHEVLACNEGLMTVILWSLKISVQLFLLRGRIIEIALLWTGLAWRIHLLIKSFILY